MAFPPAAGAEFRFTSGAEPAGCRRGLARVKLTTFPGRRHATSGRCHHLGVVSVTLERFEELVADALDGLPIDLGRAMENVAVVIDDRTPPGSLLGLYEGIPLTERGNNYSAVMPDRITIFMQTICTVALDQAEVVETVRRTVIHEVAHHFGIGDPRLRELGWG